MDLIEEIKIKKMINDIENNLSRLNKRLLLKLLIEKFKINIMYKHMDKKSVLFQFQLLNIPKNTLEVVKKFLKNKLNFKK